MTREHIVVSAGGTIATMWYRCSCGEESIAMQLDRGDRDPSGFAPWMVNHAREVAFVAAQLDGYDFTRPTSITMMVGSTYKADGSARRGPTLTWYLAGLSQVQRDEMAVGLDAWMGSYYDPTVDAKAREIMVLINALTRSFDDE